jgi:hypothetical protein
MHSQLGAFKEILRFHRLRVRERARESERERARECGRSLAMAALPGRCGVPLLRVLVLATLLSHNIPLLGRGVHQGVVVRLVHKGRGSSYPMAHVLHFPPLPPAHSYVLGPAAINKNWGQLTALKSKALRPGHTALLEFITSLKRILVLIVLTVVPLHHPLSARDEARGSEQLLPQCCVCTQKGAQEV